MKEPRIGDIWWADYPYKTPGNMKKNRPVIIRGFCDNDSILVQKLTTRKKKYNRPIFVTQLKKHTFISTEKTIIPDYCLTRYISNIYNNNNRKRVIK